MLGRQLVVRCVRAWVISWAVWAFGGAVVPAMADPPSGGAKTEAGAGTDEQEQAKPATTQGAAKMSKHSLARLVRKAAKDGRLAYRLTEPEEVVELFGKPAQDEKHADGGMEVREMQYPGLSFVFGRMREEKTPFTLLNAAVSSSSGLSGLLAGGDQIDIGQDRKIVLRSVRDLRKLDSFRGLENVSLARLDLRDQADTLRKWAFDSRTEWPGKDKLPADFEPERVLEGGKDPGLGVRGLHAQGLDGRGMHMAIIDQPLLQDHNEYKGRVEEYVPIDVNSVPPQMHGPPVTSIAIGRTCGVAPAAKLTYFAVPTWKSDNTPMCEALERILQHNETHPAAERIHVVSISSGMFPKQAHYDRWQKALSRATSSGVLVVTCDPAFLSYGVANRIAGRDADDPAGYRRGRYSAPNNVLLVPGGGRTTASYNGADVYEYWTEGGMSWCAPYLAGLATLAYQVDPQVTPERIVRLWQETATKTEAGPMVNPPAFIERVRATAGGGARSEK